MTYSAPLLSFSLAKGQPSPIVENSPAKATATTVNTLAANIAPLTGPQTIVGTAVALAATDNSSSPKVDVVVRQYSNLPVGGPKEASYSECSPMPLVEYLTLEKRGAAPLPTSIQHLECRTDDEVQIAMEKFSHVKSLTLTGRIRDFIWKTTLPNLTHLTIDGLSLYYGGFLYSMTGFLSYESLHYGAIWLRRMTTSCPGGRCPQLQHLIVKNCPNFNDDGMLAIGCIAAELPVEQITLINLRGISTLGIRSFGDTMQEYTGNLSIRDERILRWERGYRVPDDLNNPDVRFCAKYQAVQAYILDNRQKLSKGSCITRLECKN